MHTLPKLPYEYNALEPHIDAKTMEIHHTKHHQAYIDKLNAAIKGTDLENKEINEVLKNLNSVPENIRAAVRNHGGGHANHGMFWQVMSPNSGGNPSGELQKAMHAQWGDFNKFKEEFTNAAMARFGSGWAWLVVDNGKLGVMSTANQDTPLSEGKTPILGLDVWEHSFYLKHMWNKAVYIKDWWNVVNWKQVEENYSQAVK
jgi:superoxide dismutase, Fe-Mn family